MQKSMQAVSLCAQVYPTAVRSTAMGLCGAHHRLGMAISHFLVAAISGQPFGLFVSACHARICRGVPCARARCAVLFAGSYLVSFFLSAFLPYETRDRVMGGDYYAEVHACCQVVDRLTSARVAG